MAIKPSEKPIWSTNNNPADNIKPADGYRLNGVLDGEPMPREYLNFQEYWTGRWVDYVDAGMVDKDLNLSDLTNKPQALTNLGGTTVGKAVFTAGTAQVARTALGMTGLGQSVATSATQKELLNAIYPVGITYVQYPNCTAPKDLFGGSWELLFADKGYFFRTEGGNASVFESGVQQDMIGQHSHTSPVYRVNGAAQQSDLFGAPSDVQERGTATTDSAGGIETRPINVTVRVWRKTSNVE